ncbi:MAG: hypothetical protein QOG75_1286 [Mycobacterium sp.]|nr:hypothetical protein [Mycobacterium sp.]
MSIRRRETQGGVRYDVQWRLPDRSKRKKTFSTERAAKRFEAKLVTSSATARLWTHGTAGPSWNRFTNHGSLHGPTSAPKSAADTKITGGCVSSRASATG